ncbi:hypothetical protein KCP73_15890 [Salmonella enterica subsp. enterica]|nr:hypothetical protein KCP73_15890 [Salmonella enterica subsp. enterica]
MMTAARGCLALGIKLRDTGGADMVCVGLHCLARRYFRAVTFETRLVKHVSLLILDRRRQCVAGARGLRYEEGAC